MTAAGAPPGSAAPARRGFARAASTAPNTITRREGDIKPAVKAEREALVLANGRRSDREKLPRAPQSPGPLRSWVAARHCAPCANCGRDRQQLLRVRRYRQRRGYWTKRRDDASRAGP